MADTQVAEDSDQGGGGPTPVSAIVTTFNEAHNIAECLEGLQWCDEVLVVDSYSTDGTVEIARGFDKVRLVQHEYFGGSAQKNWALSRVRHDWVLILDADERCTDELRDELQGILRAGPDHEAYVMRRRCYFLDRELKHSGWSNDSVVRLFKRENLRYRNKRVHARVVDRNLNAVRERAHPIRADLTHYMVQDLGEYLDRTKRYALWGAAQAWREGRRTRGWEIFKRSVWRFLRTYVFQQGFRDGAHGLVFCMIQGIATFQKWAWLWGWQREVALGRTPALPEFDEDPDVWFEGDQLPSTGKA